MDYQLYLLQHIRNLLASRLVADIDHRFAALMDTHRQVVGSFKGISRRLLDLQDDLVKAVRLVVEQDRLPGVIQLGIRGLFDGF